jgi:ankyrin repeat protein
MKKNLKSQDRPDLLSLIDAIKRGQFQMAITILKGGVNVNTKDKNGQTALHVVSESGDLKGVNFLLTREDIKIEEKNNRGETAADLAKSKHYYMYNSLVNEQITIKSIKIEEKNNSGKTAADLAISNYSVIYNFLVNEQKRRSNSSGSVVETPSGSVVVTEHAEKLSKDELAKGK